VARAWWKPPCRWLLTDWLGDPSPKVRLSQDRLSIEPLTQPTSRWPAKLGEGETKQAGDHIAAKLGEGER
jgi:hypothetical protein